MTVAETEHSSATKRWYQKWWAWAIVIVLLGGAIGSLVEPSAQIVVPDVAGLPAVEAEKTLERAGLSVSIRKDGKITAKKQQFDAVDTDPPAGQRVSEGKRITLNVTFAKGRLEAEAAQEEAQREADRVKAEEEDRAREAELASQPLTEDNARPFCLDSADQAFPYGITVHFLAGVLAEEETEAGWYMKYEATITNEYGAERKAMIECHMSGTNGAPVMDDFLAY